MNENLKEKIIDIMTREYNDKVDANKDIKDYLNEKTKNELLSLYLLYGYAGNIEYIVEEIVELQKKKKEEVIKKIITFLENQIILIFQFLNEERVQNIKEIADNEGYYEFNIKEEEHIPFDMIKILKQLNFIFCKRMEDKIIIHMPNFIKYKINNIIGESFYLDYYESIILYSKGIANMYGTINIQDAYEIISEFLLIKFEKYESVIKFVSLLELEPIYYSFQYQALCNFNIRDEEVKELICKKEKIIKYDKKLYEDISSDEYIFNLKEYKEFRNFLKKYYEFDINKDEILRGEVINDYIDISQINESNARKNLEDALNRYFEIQEIQKKRNN